MFIENVPGDIYAQSMELSKEIAGVVCDFYVPELLEELKEWDESTTYVPDNDKNYWYWTKIIKKITDIVCIIEL